MDDVIGTSLTRPQKLGVLAGILLAALGIAWILGLGTPGCCNLPQPFSSQQWKAAAKPANHNNDIRCRMVFDLRHRIGLEGKTKEEIIDLLGEAEYAGDQENGRPLRYPLCPSFLDIYVLALEWKDGRVISTRVHDT